MRLFALVTAGVAVLTLLAGCATAPPMKTVAGVAVPRFMGDWYLRGHIPAAQEKNAWNGVESYRLAAETVRASGEAGLAADRKSLVQAGLERGRADFLAGRVLLRESLSKATLENAMEWLSGQGAFATDASGRRVVSEGWRGESSTQLVETLGRFLAS